jgi:alpha-beta hydrolase superfamily lysophospholipase
MTVESPPVTLRIDVSAAVGEPAEVLVTYFAPAGSGPARAVLACLPGASYNHRYYHLLVPGHPGYSFAEDAAARGFGVAAFDLLGTGASSRPERDVDLVDQAATTAEAVSQLPELIGHDGPILGIAHSMGGYVAMLQQAAHRSYAGLGLLGTSNQPVRTREMTPEFIAAAATAEGRAELIEQLQASMPERFVLMDRSSTRSWFHLDDVPPAVLDADTDETLTVFPRRCGAQASVPGNSIHAAAAIEVPVLLAYGALDLSPAPHKEPEFFPSSRDVTLYVLSGSAHCHNMARTRQRLWDRLARWYDTVVD